MGATKERVAAKCKRYRRWEGGSYAQQSTKKIGEVRIGGGKFRCNPLPQNVKKET